MKQKGSIFKYESQRNKELISAFKAIYSKKAPMNIDDIAREISKLPASRFWITETRAAIVISEMMRGKSLRDMRPTKREMFNEIYERTLSIKKAHPDMCIFEIVKKVIVQPAPKHYLTEKTIKVILYRILNGWYEKRKA